MRRKPPSEREAWVEALRVFTQTHEAVLAELTRQLEEEEGTTNGNGR